MLLLVGEKSKTVKHHRTIWFANKKKTTRSRKATTPRAPNRSHIHTSVKVQSPLKTTTHRAYAFLIQKKNIYSSVLFWLCLCQRNKRRLAQRNATLSALQVVQFSSITPPCTPFSHVNNEPLVSATHEVGTHTHAT